MVYQTFWYDHQRAMERDKMGRRTYYRYQERPMNYISNLELTLEDLAALYGLLDVSFRGVIAAKDASKLSERDLEGHVYTHMRRERSYGLYKISENLNNLLKGSFRRFNNAMCFCKQKGDYYRMYRDIKNKHLQMEEEDGIGKLERILREASNCVAQITEVVSESHNVAEGLNKIKKQLDEGETNV